MGKLLGGWSRDYLRGGIVYLAAAAIVIPLGCCLIFVPLWLVSGTNLGDAGTVLVLVVPMALFFIIIVGGLLAFGYRIISRRTHWLDEAMAPLGLEGSSYGISGRQYHGIFQGRQVDILFYRGPTFSMFVGTSLKTKISIAERNRLGLALAKAFKREPLTTTNSDLEDMVVYANEEAWGQALVAQSEATAVLRRLVFAESNFLLHQVHLYPESFLFKMYRSKGLFNLKISPEQIQTWFNDMVKLAEIAEALPAPQEVLEASRLERSSRTGGAAKWGLWIGVGIVAALCLLGFVPLIFGLVLALLSG